MKRIYGNITGLKAQQLRRLERLYRRRIPPEYLLTPEVAKEISLLSREIRRQVGLLINRLGKIVYVMVGNRKKIVIPDLGDYRIAADRLRGLRCVHTHLNAEALTTDDLTDLALLRLDLMGVIIVTADGLPADVHVGHILPQPDPEQNTQLMPPMRPHQLDIDCRRFIQALEAEIAFVGAALPERADAERALLVSVGSKSKSAAGESLAELRELAESSAITIVGTSIQLHQPSAARLLVGRGKLDDIALSALNKGASLIIFDRELSPAQLNAFTNKLELKVIDRTQLILDIFAQRAQSREGKLQVELAQLKYLLPRLVYKNTAMSRLTGGIGGRGPGETKLEINRRRVRERIGRLEKSLRRVRQHRGQQKSKRTQRELPIISIVGYTNAGKSTLLNTLTYSDVYVENRLFATLDPTSRRLKFPRDLEVIITDTVGFIKDLPRDLVVAFRATLEELESADLLLHVVDISHSRCKAHIQSVETILDDLDLQDIPMLRVFNKIDRTSPDKTRQLVQKFQGIPISAKDPATLKPLLQAIQSTISRLPKMVDIQS